MTGHSLFCLPNTKLNREGPGEPLGCWVLVKYHTEQGYSSTHS